LPFVLYCTVLLPCVVVGSLVLPCVVVVWSFCCLFVVLVCDDLVLGGAVVSCEEVSCLMSCLVVGLACLVLSFALSFFFCYLLNELLFRPYLFLSEQGERNNC
jgi:hypothetical protein